MGQAARDNAQARWDGGRSGMPAPAFEEAAGGSRGWGIRPADIAVIVCGFALALAACLVLWGIYGVEGVPGIGAFGAGQGSAASEQGAGEASSDSLGLDAGGTDAPAQTDAGSSGAADAGVAAAKYAVVQNKEGFYQVLSLDEDTTLTVQSSLGTNVVEVRGGQVCVREADCSNQTCVNQGWVSGNGQTIVCLPHELTVQLVADPADASLLS